MASGVVSEVGGDGATPRGATFSAAAAAETGTSGGDHLVGRRRRVNGSVRERTARAIRSSSVGAMQAEPRFETHGSQGASGFDPSKNKYKKKQKVTRLSRVPRAPYTTAPTTWCASRKSRQSRPLTPTRHLAKKPPPRFFPFFFTTRLSCLFFSYVLFRCIVLHPVKSARVLSSSVHLC